MPMPFAKIIREPSKNGFYAYFYLRFIIKKLAGSTSHLAVSGTPISRPYLAWKLFKLAGIIPCYTTVDRSRFHHDDTTEASAHSAALNGRCTDISKGTVARMFAEVFGVDLSVDPTTYVGPMVRKSQINATHDGAIVEGPLDMAEAGFEYQRLIDNSAGDDCVLDLRPCIVGDDIPFVYMKYRPIADRFSNDSTRVEAARATDVFSADEIAAILAFSRRIGLDLGELDVLRDRCDGRIYIVDVAKTPHSPGDAFINADGIRCMKLAAASFMRQRLGNR